MGGKERGEGERRGKEERMGHDRREREGLPPLEWRSDYAPVNSTSAVCIEHNVFLTRTTTTTTTTTFTDVLKVAEYEAGEC